MGNRPIKKINSSVDSGIINELKKDLKFNEAKILSQKDRSEVYFVQRKVKALCCSKQDNQMIIRVTDSDNNEERIHNILKYCKHQNIMNYVCKKTLNDKVIYCYKYYEGKNLKKMTETNGLSNLNWNAKGKLFLQIVDGINYLHQKKIIHCDIKPENIIITPDFVPKIIDFDLSIELGERNTIDLREAIGTVRYMAPESFHIYLYGFHSDIWSLGVLFYYILSGKIPFEIERNPFDRLNNMKRNDFYKNPNIDLLKRLQVPELYIALIQSMLIYNYEKRIKMEEIIKMLSIVNE